MHKDDYRLGIIIVFVAAACFMTFGMETKALVSFHDLMVRERKPPTTRLHYGKLPEQYGELWLPDGAGPHPLVILIHGGCWQAAVPGFRLMAFIAEDLRSSGIAVWNIEYRSLVSDRMGYPDTFLDVASGTDYVRQIADKYSLDLSHVVIVGHSAGGHLALWAAARGKIDASSALHLNNPLTVSAAVSLAGIGDLGAFRNSTETACGGPGTIDQLVDAKKRKDQSYYADTSPAAMLPLNVPQLIVSGDRDFIVPASFGDNYSNSAKASGDQVKVMDIRNAGHFELIDPQSAAWHEIKPILVSYLQSRHSLSTK